ncbi:hypothetical protein PAEPH01_0729 [Pancytospora epiphaga]|nr:hypothetical protein PAEPH01_0729 [Pancytospora epiphaga]
MLSICIKRAPRRDENPKISLRKFVSSYLNEFYIKLNGILRDYRSVREHGHRNGMIEFATTMIRDIELFLMVISGAYLQHNLRVTTLKRYDYMEQGGHIIGMADFIAAMFENMKASFIPKHDFSFALQAALDPSKLLPSFYGPPGSSNVKNQQPIEEGVDSSESELVKDETPSKPDFEEIDRLIKIYLLGEDISNYTIENGILTLHYRYITLEVALCGDYKSPSWMLISAKTVFEEPAIERLLVNKLPKSLRGIIAFCIFYEARRLAQDVFSNLKNEVSGFYQNFTGKILNYPLHGYINETGFVCEVLVNEKPFKFVNKAHSEIWGVLRGAENDEKVAEDEHQFYTTDYEVDVFGENITFFFNNVYLCFPKTRPLFHVGDRMDCRSCMSVGLCWNDGRLVGCSGDAPNLCPATNDGQMFSIRRILDFVRRNEEYFPILHVVLPLARWLSIDGGIATPFCRISGRYTISELPGDGGLNSDAQCWEHSSTSVEEIINKAMLLYLQTCLPVGFSIIENIVGRKFILEIHNIQVSVSPQLKAGLKYLTDDCNQFNIVDGLEYIKNFGILYKYNIFPSSWTLKQVIVDLSGLTGEMIMIEKEEEGFSIYGPNTLKMLNIGRVFNEENIHTIGMLHKAFIVNRFSHIKKIYAQGVIDKNTVELPNGNKIVLTADGLTYVLSTGLVSSEYSHLLNVSHSIIDCLKILNIE